jgi:ribose 5-phosphate isomerase B
MATKQLISRETLRGAGTIREYLYDPDHTLITAEAREYARQKGISLISRTDAGRTGTVTSKHEDQRLTDLVIGSDHGGFKLKEILKARLQQQGFRVHDVGCWSEEAVDYPDYAHQVAQFVGRGEASRGVMIDAIGVASAMVANRVPGVRAAACQIKDAVVSARRHNDANFLSIGAKVLQQDAALEMLDLFIREPFDGGRHLTRVDKINRLDRDL